MLAAFILAGGQIAVVSAQSTVSAGIRSPRFSGAAVDPVSDRSLRPYRPTMLEIGLEVGGRRFGGGLRAYYASSSLALEGSDAVAAVKDALSVYGVAPEVSFRISPPQQGPQVKLYAGPLLEVWKLPDVGSQWRLGVSASVGLEVPFSDRWSGSARIGGAVTPRSPFREEDLQEPFEPRALWRREAAAALQYRL